MSKSFGFCKAKIQKGPNLYDCSKYESREKLLGSKKSYYI